MYHEITKYFLRKLNERITTRKPPIKENYSGTTGTTNTTGLGSTRPAREINDGRGEE